jgi:hypothetical protein
MKIIELDNGKLTIRSNYHWRPYKYFYEYSEKIQEFLRKEFDYIEEEEELQITIFFKYRNSWYTLGDFMRLDKNSSFPKNWNGAAGDTYFSGTLIELDEEGESYRIGNYYS